MYKQVTNGINTKVRNHHPWRGGITWWKEVWNQADLESIQAPPFSY